MYLQVPDSVNGGLVVRHEMVAAGQVSISGNHNGKRYRHLEKAGCCGMVAGEGRFRSMYLLWYICLSVYLASAIPDR